MQWWIGQEPTQDEGDQERDGGGEIQEGPQQQHPRDVAEDQESDEEGVPADIQQ